jgi:hypothetical protein
MTGEVRAGIAVLAAVVAAVILWLALGPGPERHDGLTRIQAARRAAGGIASDCDRRVVCRPAGGHWGCTLTLADGRVVRTTTDPAAPATAIAFFTSSC